MFAFSLKLFYDVKFLEQDAPPPKLKQAPKGELSVFSFFESLRRPSITCPGGRRRPEMRPGNQV